MTKERTPTPTPWEACERGDYSDYDGDCIVILGDDKRVAIVFDEDDAALVVKAVNSHAALTARIAELQASLRDTEDAILACERGGTIAAVVANYRTVRRTIQDVRARLTLQGGDK